MINMCGTVTGPSCHASEDRPWTRSESAPKNPPEFGVNVASPVTVDMKQVKARKDAIVQSSNSGVTGWMKGLDHGTVFEGHGRFEGPNTVGVNGETLEADKVFVNVGARASVPPIPGLDEVDYFTNSNMMNVDFLPPHLVIIGGSYIAQHNGWWSDRGS